MWFRLLIGCILVLSLAGCTSSKKKITSIPVQELQTKPDYLEKSVSQKEKVVSDLKCEFEKIKYNSRQIQTALKKANFYKGPIDGKIGKETKKAIIEFQKANGLFADGVVGRQTWLKLKRYLEHAAK